MNQLNIDLTEELNKLINIYARKKVLSRNTVLHLLLEKDRLNNEDLFPLCLKYLEENDVILTDDNVELESTSDDETSSLVESVIPFDATKINITPRPITVDGIVKRLIHKEIDLNTPFQRKAGLWSDETKSQLIESLMLRIPIPVFYFDGTKEEKWLVIDGLQRLTTFNEFFVLKTLTLSGLEYFTDYNGCRVDDIPRAYIRRMEETQLTLNVIQPGTPPNVKYNIFKRINTPALKLEPQEIRNALYQGKAVELLKKLTNNNLFHKLVGVSVSNERMLASEFILRYIAIDTMRLETFVKYKEKMEIFLNNAMENLNQFSVEQIKDIEAKFIYGLKIADEIFGDYAFRRISPNNNSRKNPINVALFEAWLLVLSNLSKSDSKILISRKDKLKKRFYELLQEKTFGYDINSGKKIAIERRINLISKIVKEVIAYVDEH